MFWPETMSRRKYASPTMRLLKLFEQRLVAAKQIAVVVDVVVSSQSVLGMVSVAR